jgi:hypothetical protein
MKKMKKKIDTFMLRKRRKTLELGVSRMIHGLVIQFNDVCVSSVINYGLTVCCGIRNLKELRQRNLIFGKLIRVHDYDHTNRATIKFEESVGNKVKKPRSSGTIESLKENLLKWLKYKYRKMDSDNFDEFYMLQKMWATQES